METRQKRTIRRVAIALGLMVLLCAGYIVLGVQTQARIKRDLAQSKARAQARVTAMATDFASMVAAAGGSGLPTDDQLDAIATQQHIGILAEERGSTLTLTIVSTSLYGEIIGSGELRECFNVVVFHSAAGIESTLVPLRACPIPPLPTRRS